MPRDIPVGNGRLLICFDKEYRIRDIYFPHVGQENHVSGNPFRFGVWAEGQFSWVGHGWKRSLLYLEDTLVTEVSLHHPGLGLIIVCHDAVDFHENIYVREIGVENLQPREREIRLFFSQNFDISGHSVGDTVAYDPPTGGLVHYKGARYFLVNGMDGEGRGLSQFAVGQKNVKGREGTFRDAEDGRLSGNPIAQGSVDSAVALHLTLPPHGKGIAYYWLGAAETWKDVRQLDRRVREKGPQTLLRRTGDYWRLWARKATPPLEFLPQAVQKLYRRSLLVLRTQIDWQGGILAGNDSDVILFNRDTYSYVWPRDGALVANALDLAGYPMAAQNFYRFAADVIGRDGYFFHKYNPDGTLASSWHPWFSNGREQLPIQEDETALVLWALWKHFSIFRDIDFIKPLYLPLVKGAADFLCRYRDPETGLPIPSYDLWEERRGVLSFTLARGIGARTILELGTATGYSAIHLAEACGGGSGKVITVEYDQDVAHRARENIRCAGLHERVEVRMGAVPEVLEGMNGPVDFIFMDIDKQDYAKALGPCRKLLREGGLLFVDNTGFEGARDFNRAVASDPGWRYVQLLSFLPGHSPERDGLCLALRL
jgi:glucoamylase